MLFIFLVCGIIFIVLGEGGGEGDCLFFFGWFEVDEDLVLEWGDLWFLVFIGESYGCVFVFMF